MIPILLLLIFASVLNGQSAAERCATALLRGDPQTAAEAATSAGDPAERERLQAALLPLSQRPAAMLAVAARYPESVQADLAILAGAAAALVQRDRGAALPELLDWQDFELGQYDDGEWVAGPFLEGLLQQLAKRRALGGDFAILAEAERMLSLCSVSRVGFEPARLAPTAHWRLPERREDLLLRAWRRQPGIGNWSELLQVGVADWEVQLPVSKKGPIQGLPTGDWLLELASTTSPWRGVRVVEVSDLDVFALSDGKRAAIAAFRREQPVGGADWWLRTSDGATARGAFVGTTTLLCDEALGEPGELFVQTAGQTARVPLFASSDTQRHGDRFQVHLMVDRSIYQPGETVQGRLVLRETRYEGVGVDAIAHSAVLANQQLELHAFADEDEVQLTGRSDAHGVWSFAVPVPERTKPGAIRLAVFLPQQLEPIYDGRPCDVRSFRRSAVAVDVVGERMVARGNDATVAVRAVWASGAPAAGLSVHASLAIRADGVGWYSEAHDLTTGPDGLAALQLQLAVAKASHVNIEFVVSTPSGPKKLEHRLWVASPEVANHASAALPRSLPLAVHAPATVVVSEPCIVQVEGRANSNLLVVVGRGRCARSQIVPIAANGKGQLTVTPTRDEWPALDLAVASRTHVVRRRVPLLLHAAAAPEVTLPERALPGAEVACRVATKVAGTVVTVAVVDERIFAIADDRTEDPSVALRPNVAAPSWRHSSSAAAMSPQDLLAQFLDEGKVPSSCLAGPMRAGFGASGGPASASPGSGGNLRTEFRATAAFATVVADGDGIANLSLALPDDLTTWRVTLIGTASDGSAFHERRQLVTRLPLAAEPILPRVLRAGDSVRMPIVVDRQVGTGERTSVQLSAVSTSAAATIVDGECEVVVAGGAATRTLVTLQGIAAGPATISLSANIGDDADRSQRTLAVQADAVLRPLSVAEMAVGQVMVTTPEGCAPDEGLDVTVLGGSSVAWAEIERRLSTYPYGCVEQTLSKLTPFFAAVRGAKAHGIPPPIAEDGFQERLQAGLRRIRQLQVSPGGAFSFWPGQQVDLPMTVLVLHGLAGARDGGLEVQRFGLACDVTREPFVGATCALLERNGQAASAAELLQGELAAACLRFQPTAVAARAAVVALLACEQALPAGLLLRCGLALVAAGDTERAATCLARAAGLQREPQTDSTFPGENPLAVRALQLELQCVLHPVIASPDLAMEVLLGCLNGYSTTYAQACALSALALALPRRDATEFVVKVRVGDELRELPLNPENHFTARWRAPFGARCLVVGPSEQQLVVRVAGQCREPGSQHQAWSSPLLVMRDLCRRIPEASAEQRQRGEDLVPIDAAGLLVGEVVWLRVRLSSPEVCHYVVVDCPLPAGFELAEEMPWLERFDDRVAFSCTRVGAELRDIAIPLVPTLVGRMVWPPTTATPMYSVGRDGGTAGALVSVLAASADQGRASVVTCLHQAQPVASSAPLPRPWHDFDRAMRVLHRAFYAQDVASLELASSAAKQAWDHLRRPGGELEYALHELTETVRLWRRTLQTRTERGPIHAKRMAALQQLVAQQYDGVVQLFDLYEQDRGGGCDSDNVETLVAGLLLWPMRELREEMLARVLELAMVRDQLSPDVLDEFEGPVENEELRAVLVAMLVTHTELHGARILHLLPQRDLAGLAPAVLFQVAQSEWPHGLVAVLLDSPLGRAELARALRDPQFVSAQAENLVRELPYSYWRTVPLGCFAKLYDLELPNLCIPELLAAAPIATAALQRELIASLDVGWQATLATALRMRGVKRLGDEKSYDDTFVDAWRRTIALSSEDATRALPLYREMQGRIGADPLCQFLLAIILRGGSPPQLAEVAGDADEQQLRAVWARLEAEASRQLLAATVGKLAALPIAKDAADAAALWAYANRHQEHWDVMLALCRSKEGIALAMQHFAAIEDKDDREWYYAAFAAMRGLDPDTGLAPVHEPWQPLLHTVAQRGPPADWTTTERQCYDRVRALRGVR